MQRATAFFQQRPIAQMRSAESMKRTVMRPKAIFSIPIEGRRIKDPRRAPDMSPKMFNMYPDLKDRPPRSESSPRLSWLRAEGNRIPRRVAAGKRQTRVQENSRNVLSQNPGSSFWFQKRT